MRFTTSSYARQNRLDLNHVLDDLTPAFCHFVLQEVAADIVQRMKPNEASALFTDQLRFNEVWIKSEQATYINASKCFSNFVSMLHACWCLCLCTYIGIEAIGSSKSWSGREKNGRGKAAASCSWSACWGQGDEGSHHWKISPVRLHYRKWCRISGLSEAEGTQATLLSPIFFFFKLIVIYVVWCSWSSFL